MRKLFFASMIVSILFLSISGVSAVDSTNFTVNQVINSASNVKVYVETNHRLPNTVNIAGTQVTMPQFLEIMVTAVININNDSKAPVTLKNYKSSVASSENITGTNINKAEYLDIANRVKSYMNIKGQAPNYATQKSTGSTINSESLVYMYSKVLNYYKTNSVLPAYVAVKPWKEITDAKNNIKLMGSTSYGYVEKEAYGNQYSSRTIVLIVGVHPQENGIHTAIAKDLASKSSRLNKRYVIYKVHVTKDIDNYSQSRMNGQLLAQKFVVPDVPREYPMLVVDNHENHGANSGYVYYRFLYPISDTAITTSYANKIIGKMPFLVIYTPPNHTSPEYVTIPISNYGIPTIIYETYSFDPVAKKASDASALLNALDVL